MNGSDRHEQIKIKADSVQFDGILDIAKNGKGIVLFAHGSGSRRAGRVFDIDLLAQRLRSATEWVQQNLKDSKIGYFGSSTGAAAALKASAEPDSEISTLVSRGGRPDIVMPILERVKAPTLLIVGGNNFEVLRLNKLAYDSLLCEKELKASREQCIYLRNLENCRKWLT